MPFIPYSLRQIIESILKKELKEEITGRESGTCKEIGV